MNITFNGNPVTLKGNELKVGDVAPDFLLTDTSLNDISLADTKGKRVFVVVPSLDTPICDLSAKRFNEEATKFDNVSIYVVSMDLPFALTRWCGANSSDRITTLSDYKHRSFGENYGVYINELGLLTRSIFIVDEDNKISYVEYCKEIKSEPDFESALNALK
ncbi:thiol peroxidase [[Clostridium] colinum]|uniref:thiol peroxidase n=1 Tax=[Clostridium] colinum TaxID=36835 RepID=UPI0020256AF3|nr:thiol peroxidase [[Clostridium] colinum]